MKRIFHMLILGFFFTFLFISNPAFAAEEKKEEANVQTCVNIMSESDTNNIEAWKSSEASLEETYMTSIIQIFFGMGGVNSLPNLIFGNPYCLWNETDQVVYHMFSETDLNDIIKPIIKILSSSYVMVLTLAILISSLRVGLSSMSLRGRKEFWTDVNYWIVTALFMLVYWQFIEVLLNFNSSIVNELAAAADRNGYSLYGFTLINTETGLSLTSIILFLAEWLVAFILNIVYIMRHVAIMLLIFLGPVAAMSLLFENTRNFFKAWLLKLIGFIFVQSIHAMIMFMVIGLSTLAKGDSFLFKLGLLIMFMPLTTMLMGMLFSMTGLHEGVVTTFSNVAKTIMNQKTGGSAKGGPSLNSGNQNTRLSTLAKGSSGWQSMKQGVGKVGGVTGSLAGLVLGPQGAKLGAAVGNKAAQGLMQGGRNMVVGAAGVKDAVSKARTGGFRNNMQNLASRRDFGGNLGESIGTMAGIGSVGRSAGFALSGVSKQKLFNGPESAGGREGKTLEDLSKAFPGSDMQWRQTNQSSGFYHNQGGTWKPVGVPGNGDGNLASGEQRVMNYQFGNGSPYSGNGQGYSLSGPGGLNSSSQMLSRTSGPSLSNSTGGQLQDSRFDPRSVNPDSYFNANLPSSQSTSDRVGSAIDGWKGSAGFGHSGGKRSVI